MKYFSILFVAAAACLSATPALAETVVSGTIAAVTVSKDTIQTGSLSGVQGAICGKPDKLGKGEACYLAFEANPSWFAGKQICVSGRRDFWSVRRDGVIVNEGLRVPVCAPISPNGTVSLSVNFPTGFDPFIAEGGRIVAWASRDDLGLPVQ
ncbi:MAG: hypothetical protein A2808_03425 [Candidatus Moranbacteria bacterium RIFCSPHIGHO2_01_FULL_55_24]|nr:MAG: hypothetical protein A2808_03425 [Candidatus Moranbacteria bacterium RIFCSPHIGHO2_01_FULL_55_24]